MASGTCRGEVLVLKFGQEVTLSPSRGIPFNELVLSQSNVRRIKSNISVEKRAVDITRRWLPQSVSVRHVLGNDDSETGKFEIAAPDRYFQALSLLLDQKRLAKTTGSLSAYSAFPCIYLINYAHS